MSTLTGNLFGPTINKHTEKEREKDKHNTTTSGQGDTVQIRVALLGPKINNPRIEDWSSSADDSIDQFQGGQLRLRVIPVVDSR